MKIHHLNCGTMCPWGGRLMDGESPLTRPARLVCHCLAIEGRDGITLVDTGFGLGDVRAPFPRLSRFYCALLRPQLDEASTAVRQLEALGARPADVRHIVLTHLDFDHAGGIEDFPNAIVHVHADEFDAARHRDTLVARGRYRPQQWDERIQWRLHRPAGERWFGFDAVHPVEGTHDEVLMVPLMGHTYGHCGVAVRRGEGWLLHCGDAYFFREEANVTPRCPPGLRAYQWLMEVDRAARRENQRRLRELAFVHGDEVLVCSSHDAREFDALAAGAAFHREELRPVVEAQVAY